MYVALHMCLLTYIYVYDIHCIKCLSLYLSSRQLLCGCAIIKKIKAQKLQLHDFASTPGQQQFQLASRRFNTRNYKINCVTYICIGMCMSDMCARININIYIRIWCQLIYVLCMLYLRFTVIHIRVYLYSLIKTYNVCLSFYRVFCVCVSVTSLFMCERHI